MLKSKFSIKKFYSLISSLGIRIAAGYARNNGVSFETCYCLMFDKFPRR